MADMKKVIMPTTHIKFLFFLEVMTSVTTLKPSDTEYKIQNIIVVHISACEMTHCCVLNLTREGESYLYSWEIRR